MFFWRYRLTRQSGGNRKKIVSGQVSGCCLQGTHNVDTVRLTGRGATPIHSAEFCTSGSRSYRKKKKKKILGPRYQLLWGSQSLASSQENSDLFCTSEPLRESYRFRPFSSKQVTKAQEGGDQCWGGVGEARQPHRAVRPVPAELTPWTRHLPWRALHLHRDGGHADHTGAALPLRSPKVQGPSVGLVISASSPRCHTLSE